MKPPLPIVLPPRGSRGRLPFLLVPALAGMAAVQLAMPGDIHLPPTGTVAHVGVAALPDAPPPVIAPPLQAGRDLFSPPARPAGAGGSADPLGGAVVAGVVQKDRLRLGVVQQPNGQVRYVGLGGNVAGWRLTALGQAEARLTRGPGQSLTVAYGMHPVPVKNTDIPATASAPPPVSGPQGARPPQFSSFASPQTLESGQ